MIPRYETPEIKKIWTDENRFSKWLAVETAASQAWNEKGVVPDKDFKNIKEKAGFSVERIREIEEVTQHDVIAFVSSVAEYEDYEKYFVDEAPYTDDEIKKLSEMSFDDLDKAATALSIEDVKKRHA